MTFDGVFKRVEKKYRVTAAQRHAVEDAARNAGGMGRDRYGRSLVTSLYLDTPRRDMIARSVEKPLYKEKVRLRAYGEFAGAALMGAFAAGPLMRTADGAPLADREVERRARIGLASGRAALAEAHRGAADGGATTGGASDGMPRATPFGMPGGAEGALLTTPVFFGIKKKFEGIVYKRRLALSLPTALAFASGLAFEQAHDRWPLADAEQPAQTLAPATRQIARELAAAMDRWLPLGPSMGIACEREAWGYVPAALSAHEGDPLFDAELRITFDDRLAYLDCHHLDASWRPLVGTGESIMEIKSVGPYPPWLVGALSANALYPASFTKYGHAYRMAV